MHFEAFQIQITLKMFFGTHAHLCFLIAHLSDHFTHTKKDFHSLRDPLDCVFKVAGARVRFMQYLSLELVAM